MWRKQLGAAAIEFALVLPLYLLIIDGVMEISIVMYDQAIVLNAAREAARAGVVLSKPKMSHADIAAVAQRYAHAYALSFGGADQLIVTVNQSADGYYQTPLRVKVDFTYTSLMVGSFLSAIQQPLVLSSTAVLLNE